MLEVMIKVYVGPENDIYISATHPIIRLQRNVYEAQKSKNL